MIFLRAIAKLFDFENDLDFRRCVERNALVNTVALGGGSASGEFFWVLTLTDVYSGYTYIYPGWCKTAKNIVAALKKAIAEIPFKIKELHTDNGSEFLNEVVRDFVRAHITRTTTRTLSKKIAPVFATFSAKSVLIKRNFLRICRVRASF